MEGCGELNKSLHSLQNSLLTGKHELLLLLHSLLLQVDKEGQKVTSTYQRDTTTQSTLVLAELPAFLLIYLLGNEPRQIWLWGSPRGRTG